MRKILVVIGAVVLSLVMAGASFGESVKQPDPSDLTQVQILNDLNNDRMMLALEIQLKQFEVEGLVKKMREYQEKAQKIQLEINKLKDEFMGLTDKINAEEPEKK